MSDKIAEIKRRHLTGEKYGPATAAHDDRGVLLAEVKRLRAENATLERANAELNVEVSRLYACRDELRNVTEAMDDPAINNTVSLVDAMRALKAERDEARAEVEWLRHERRQLRARLVECLPWVGHIPLPNAYLFFEMILARELAEDTLKEVKP